MAERSTESRRGRPTQRLSIAITADPGIAVPPLQYGGIERIVDLVVRGLVEKGHEVVLFADRESRVPCELIPLPGQSVSRRFDVARNATAISATVMRRRFDIVHSFGRLAYLSPLAFSSVPKLMSYQRAITPASVLQAQRLFGGSISFSAVSRSMTLPVESLADWHIIYNGVPTETYRFVPSVPSDAPLMFLGRLAPEKGAHVAIEVAKRSGRRLLIAGNVVDEHREYFESRIQTAVDGDRITYVGPVDDTVKSGLLGRSAALLMPILWDEPFGIVMTEALACGTPVIGLARGSVPEVVVDGVTGVVAADVDGMVDGVRRIAALDRAACRADAEARFSAEVLVDRHEAVYAHCIAKETVSAMRLA